MTGIRPANARSFDVERLMEKNLAKVVDHNGNVASTNNYNHICTLQ